MQPGKTYSDRQIEILRETSMVAILADLGYSTVKSANGLYLSPFREESNGSLHINDHLHVWCDHGGYDPRSRSGKPGGDTISFVQTLRGCSFREALDYLASFNPSITPISEEERTRRSEENRESRVSVTAVEDIWRRDLLEYAVGRRLIPADLLKAYCSQVRYRIGDSGRDLYAIGFPNRAGGWVLRNGSSRGLSKFCTKGDVTVIDASGEFRTADITPSSDKVAVFEGFFDFLSWMAWNSLREPTLDVVVLNSTSNLSHAAAYIAGHLKIASYLDNDPTGRKATEVLSAYCGTAEREDGRRRLFLDNSREFPEGGDLNELWTAACRKALEREQESEEISAGMHR